MYFVCLTCAHTLMREWCKRAYSTQKTELMGTETRLTDTQVPEKSYIFSIKNYGGSIVWDIISLKCNCKRLLTGRLWFLQVGIFLLSVLTKSLFLCSSSSPRLQHCLYSLTVQKVTSWRYQKKTKLYLRPANERRDTTIFLHQSYKSSYGRDLIGRFLVNVVMISVRG